jgi:hypothetical protein
VQLSVLTCRLRRAGPIAKGMPECNNTQIHKYGTLALKRKKEQNGCKNVIKLTATILTK